MRTYGSVRIRWRSRVIAGIFAATVIVIAGSLLVSALHLAYPMQLADSLVVARVRRAAELDPRNDIIQYQLGLAERWTDQDTAEAVRHFRRAAALNPNRFEYFSDLAQSCFGMGDLDCAESAYTRAAFLAPMRPGTRWDVANYYLVTGQRDKALAAFSNLLAVAPENSRAALDSCLRAYGDPAVIWREVVRPLHNARVQLTFMQLLAERQSADISEYWKETRTDKFTFNDAAGFLDTLLANGSYDMARRAWEDMQGAGILPAGDASACYNGDFENEPLNHGFDWHFYSQEFIEISLDKTTAHTGHTSLRIDFSVPHNDDYTPVFDVVPVTPGRPATVTAWVKSDGITSDSGPRLRIVDLNCDACLDVSSEPTTGTTAWHQVQVSFTPGEHTNAVRIMVWRSRSRTFPMDISGTFWLDSVTLKSSPMVASTK